MAAGAHGFLYMTKGDAKFPTRVRVFGDHNQAMGKLEDVPTTPQVAVQSDHAQQLEALLDEGKEVVVEIQVDSEFKPGPIELNNVVAEIPGTEKPDEVVIVCGHLDSWHQAQGCTDNGTGTTSTMEAARILAKVGVKPTRTIRFILWGGEEEGLLGSVAYVKQHRAEMDKISCAFNHDTGTNWAQSMSVSASMLAPMQRVFAPVMQLKSPEPDFTGPVFNLKKLRSSAAVAAAIMRRLSPRACLASSGGCVVAAITFNTPGTASGTGSMLPFLNTKGTRARSLPWQRWASQTCPSCSTTVACVRPAVAVSR